MLSKPEHVLSSQSMNIDERCRYFSWEAFAHVAKRTFVVGLRAQNADLDVIAGLADRIIALRTQQAAAQVTP
jgi:hypothetical protein